MSLFLSFQYPIDVYFHRIAADSGTIIFDTAIGDGVGGYQSSCAPVDRAIAGYPAFECQVIGRALPAKPDGHTSAVAGVVAEINNSFVIGQVVESHPGTNCEAIFPDGIYSGQLNIFTAILSAAVRAGSLVKQQPFASLSGGTLRAALDGSVQVIPAVVVRIAVTKTVIAYQAGLSLQGERHDE